MARRFAEGGATGRILGWPAGLVRPCAKLFSGDWRMYSWKQVYRNQGVAMKNQKKSTSRVKLTGVNEELARKMAREIEGSEKGCSTTGWNDPYRASGNKHSIMVDDEA